VSPAATQAPAPPPRPPRRRRRATLLFLLAAGSLLYLGASVRHLAAPDAYYVVDAPWLHLTPRRLQPGWHLVPRLLARLSIYPATRQRTRADLSGDRAAVSREGARLEIETELTYDLPQERVLDLHRTHGPDYERSWLRELLRKATLETLATSSYDLVRDRDPALARAVRTQVQAAIETAGLRIDGVRVVPIAGAGETSGEIRRVDTATIERRLVILGIDSFDWQVAEPLLRAGRMPNLQRLIARGTRANLKTIRPILSPVIWTSIATGAKPSRHGIVDFVVTARDSGAIVPVTSAMRQVPALWTLLSRQGLDVNVVAWWATWPAETVRGDIVTDRVAFQLFRGTVGQDWKSTDPAANRGKTYPPGLFEEIRPLIRAPSEIDDRELGEFLPQGADPESATGERGDLLRDFRTVIAAGRTYHAIALRLLHDHPAPLNMFYYEGPDTTSHLFMRYRPPLLPGVDPADMRLFGGIVDRYYERQDTYIGAVVDAAGPDATIVLVSDHGFKSAANRPPHSDPRIGKGNAADWHTPVGMMVMAGPDLRRGFDLGSASVLDVVPTVLEMFGLPVARDMDGQPLSEALTADFVQRHPVSWIDTYGGVRPPLQEETLASGSGDAEMLEKLRNLGYIGEERMTARNNRGVIALDEGNVDAAIADFEKALGSGEAEVMVRTNLARAWLMKGDLDKARAFAEQALRLEPDNKQAELLLGGTALKAGDRRAAERHLRRALAIDPTFVQAHSKLGELLQKSGRDDEALAEFRKVVAIAPLSPIELNDIGNIYRKRGDVEQAITAYREALRCDAQYIGAYNNLGLCLQEKGRLDAARALYDKALTIRPENPILRNSLGTLLALQGDRAGAIEQFRAAVKADPDWGIARGNLATLLFESGRAPEALPAFEAWVEKEPDSIEARLGLGLARLMSGDRAGAVASFGDVLQREPDNFRAHVALGETLMRSGDLEQARRHLERAAAVEKGVPRVHNDLGEIYLKLGMNAQAERAFRTSLSLDPKQDAIRSRLAEVGGAAPTGAKKKGGP
jgi:Flp pilus assembly protein TadD